MICQNEDFIYDSESGGLVHARNKGGVKKYSPCSTKPDKGGYLIARFKGKIVKQHRLAWFLVYGEWPNGQIDHQNKIRNDNRISNLRVVDQSNQSRNVKRRIDNTSGQPGVVYFLSIQKWTANIFVRGKRIFLGTYDDWHSAYNKRKTAEIIFNFHPNHGKKR